MVATDQPIIEIRAKEKSGWLPCQDAAVREGVLVIEYDTNNIDMIPLHVIRGPIEIRPNGEVQS